MNTSTNTLRFSYGSSTATQSVAINQALAAAGAGIKVVGYNYSWQIMNDLSNGGGTRGTLTGQVNLTGADNSVLKTYSYDYSKLNTGNAFQLVTGTETFGPQYDPSALKNITVSFTGKDQNWWAGYYGPRVREPDIRLNYMTDPCATNPAYSPSCTNYNSVKFSGSLGSSYAISTALAHSGSGVTVYGFDYGFNWYTGQNCTFDFIICWSWGPASLGVGVAVTNSSNQVVASKSYGYYAQNTGGYEQDSIRFKAGLNQLSLGNFAISAGGDGGSYISNAWSRMVYGADPCEKNPLYSSSCYKFVDTVLANTKAAQKSLMASTEANNTGTASGPTVNALTASTTTTAMADPVKNDVTNTNIGGAQITASGEVTAVTGVPKVIPRPLPAEPLKEKEKEKPLAKVPTPPAPPATARRVRQSDDGGVSIALASASASMETAQVQQKTETQQSQAIAAAQQTASAPVVIRRMIQSDTAVVESSQQESVVASSSALLKADATNWLRSPY